MTTWQQLQTKFEPLLQEFIQTEMQTDLAHDYAHVLRVIASAKQLAKAEGAELAVVMPAAYLHDCVSLPKNHPQRKQASSLAAEKACQFLTRIAYPAQYLPAIAHAIAAHSFSAGIAAESIEAKVVQDADRLDSLGAIGVSRCLQVSAQLGRPLYSSEDPLCQQRQADDQQFTLDHFYQKLFKLKELMHTQAGREEATLREAFMRRFLEQLASEL